MWLKIGPCALTGRGDFSSCMPGCTGSKNLPGQSCTDDRRTSDVHPEACQSFFFLLTKPKLILIKCIHGNAGRQRQATANTHKSHKSGETIGRVCPESMKRGGQTKWSCSLSGRHVPLLHKRSPVLGGWTETERGFFVLCNSTIVLEPQPDLKRRSLTQAHDQPVLMM